MGGRFVKMRPKRCRLDSLEAKRRSQRRLAAKRNEASSPEIAREQRCTSKTLLNEPGPPFSLELQVSSPPNASRRFVGDVAKLGTVSYLLGCFKGRTIKATTSNFSKEQRTGFVQRVLWSEVSYPHKLIRRNAFDNFCIQFRIFTLRISIIPPRKRSRIGILNAPFSFYRGENHSYGN